MSGSAAAANELRDAVLQRYDALRHAVSQASAAVLALRGAGDLMDVLRETDRFSLACEALGDLATDMHKSADQAMCRVMEDAGVPGIRTAHHTVSTRRTPARLDIIDAQAVPEEFVKITQKIAHDIPAIKRWVENHPDTNWATLTEGGVTLQRRSNK